MSPVLFLKQTHPVLPGAEPSVASGVLWCGGIAPRALKVTVPPPPWILAATWRVSLTLPGHYMRKEFLSKASHLVISIHW